MKPVTQPNVGIYHWPIYIKDDIIHEFPKCSKGIGHFLGRLHGTRGPFSMHPLVKEKFDEMLKWGIIIPISDIFTRSGPHHLNATICNNHYHFSRQRWQGAWPTLMQVHTLACDYGLVLNPEKSLVKAKSVTSFGWSCICHHLSFHFQCIPLPEESCWKMMLTTSGVIHIRKPFTKSNQ